MSWPAFWMKTNWKTALLMPLSRLVCKEATRRLHKFRSTPVPATSRAVVVVVGNIVVGGSGKTPFILWLVKRLQAHGLKVGIISRGYGGKSKNWPQWVDAQSSPERVGDEPVLLAKHLKCPIVVDPNRNQALNMLQQREEPDVIISDDGLQHYSLARDIEIVMVDANRLWGNRLCLPAGPLREPLARLDEVDYIVYNGLKPIDGGLIDSEVNQQACALKSYEMALQPLCFRQVADPQQHRPLHAFKGQSVQAMAGIGNPQRFFDTLERLEVEVDGRPFADHQAYRLSDFEWVKEEKPLLMTEKDAVKCSEIAQKQQKHNWWFLEVEAQADEALFDKLYAQINSVKRPV